MNAKNKKFALNPRSVTALGILIFILNVLVLGGLVKIPSSFGLSSMEQVVAFFTQSSTAEVDDLPPAERSRPERATADVAIAEDEVVLSSIPAAEPHPEMTTTFSEALTGTSEGAGISGYVLGSEGVSAEMTEAWSAIEPARDPAVPDEQDTQDPELFHRAAGEIGYVPAGYDPDAVRSLKDPVIRGADGTVAGQIEFVTGDLASVGGQSISLQGVRAPGESDTCETAEGQLYSCAEWSLTAMTTIVSGREVTCQLAGETLGDKGAKLGWCDITLKSGARRDLAEIGVEAGALTVHAGEAGLSPYLRAEKKARDARNGIWSGVYESAKN